MIYRVNMNRELLWINAAVAIAMILACSIGLTSALPQPRGQAQPQAQGNVTVIYDKGLIQALEGNYSGALSLYKKVLTIDPYDPYTLTSIGRVLYNLHNYTGAVQYFDKALALDPRHVYALDYKGLALYRLGNYSQALASYNSGLSLDPYMYDMLDTKALSLIKLGNLTDALSTLDAALALDPRDEYAFYNKALVLIELGLDKHNFGDMGAALENLDMALDINSDDKDALRMKALLTQLLTSTYENTTYGIKYNIHLTGLYRDRMHLVLLLTLLRLFLQPDQILIQQLVYQYTWINFIILLPH